MYKKVETYRNVGNKGSYRLRKQKYKMCENDNVRKCKNIDKIKETSRNFFFTCLT